jgi:hypothetical protein
MGNGVLADQRAVITEYRDSGHESAEQAFSVLFDSLPTGMAAPLTGRRCSRFVLIATAGSPGPRPTRRDCPPPE